MLHSKLLDYEKICGGRSLQARRFVNFLIKNELHGGVGTPPSSSELKSSDSSDDDTSSEHDAFSTFKHNFGEAYESNDPLRHIPKNRQLKKDDEAKTIKQQKINEQNQSNHKANSIYLNYETSADEDDQPIEYKDVPVKSKVYVLKDISWRNKEKYLSKSKFHIVLYLGDMKLKTMDKNHPWANVIGFDIRDYKNICADKPVVKCKFQHEALMPIASVESQYFHTLLPLTGNLVWNYDNKSYGIAFLDSVFSNNLACLQHDVQSSSATPKESKTECYQSYIISKIEQNDYSIDRMQFVNKLKQTSVRMYSYHVKQLGGVLVSKDLMEGMPHSDDLYYTQKLQDQLALYSHPVFYNILNQYLREGDHVFSKQKFKDNWSKVPKIVKLFKKYFKKFDVDDVDFDTKPKDPRGLPGVSFYDFIIFMKQYLDDYIEKLDKGFANQGIRWEVERKLFRGGRFTSTETTWRFNKGYTSTSCYYDEQLFTNYFLEDNECCLFEIHVPPGYPMLNMKVASLARNEQEVLLPRNLILDHIEEKFVFVNNIKRKLYICNARLDDINKYNKKQEKMCLPFKEVIIQPTNQAPNIKRQNEAKPKRKANAISSTSSLPTDQSKAKRKANDISSTSLLPTDQSKANDIQRYFQYDIHDPRYRTTPKPTYKYDLFGDSSSESEDDSL
jgi:hypothetical protein